jgi:DNA invertase Pin-like site-specific DNA recombinase
MRLIPYVRVSTEEQADTGHSLTAQRETLQRYGMGKGLCLLETLVDEGVSGGRDLNKRRGGARLLERLRRDEADGVLVTRVDRLFRDLFDALNFTRECSRRGWSIVAVNEPVDTTTPAGRLQLNIMLAVAQHEREIASVRTQAVSTSLRERGKVFGVVPYGTRNVDGMLLRDPATWPWRVQIVAWYVGQRYSLRTIAGMLRDQRIAAPAGGRTWSTSTLAGVIETHDSLTHLPALHGEQIAAPLSLTTETVVSREPRIEHNSAAAEAGGAG